MISTGYWFLLNDHISCTKQRIPVGTHIQSLGSDTLVNSDNITKRLGSWQMFFPEMLAFLILDYRFDWLTVSLILVDFWNGNFIFTARVRSCADRTAADSNNNSSSRTSTDKCLKKPITPSCHTKSCQQPKVTKSFNKGHQNAWPSISPPAGHSLASRVRLLRSVSAAVVRCHASVDLQRRKYFWAQTNVQWTI